MRLTWVRGRYTGESYPLTEAEVTFGRSPDSTFYFEERAAARRHAVLRVTPTPGQFLLNVHGYTGVVVNGAPHGPQGGPVVLRGGDTIELCGHAFELRNDPPPVTPEPAARADLAAVAAEASLQTRTLAASLDALYEVLGGTGIAARMEHCPCGCVQRERLEPLYLTPTRALEPAQLGYYAAKAITTIGDVSDFKRRVPRLVELELEGRSACYPGQLAEKLEYAGWRAWPRGEQLALLGVLRAHHQTALASQGEAQREMEPWAESAEPLDGLLSAVERARLLG